MSLLLEKGRLSISFGESVRSDSLLWKRLLKFVVVVVVMIGRGVTTKAKKKKKKMREMRVIDIGRHDREEGILFGKGEEERKR